MEVGGGGRREIEGQGRMGRRAETPAGHRPSPAPFWVPTTQSWGPTGRGDQRGSAGPLTGVAELALPAAGAEAAEGVHLVDARAPVAAWLPQTVVDVCRRRR